MLPSTDESFLIQSIPMYSPTKIVKIIKSIIAREMFERVPQIKIKLWGGEFWTDGYFINTAGKHNTETAIKNYIQNQGRVFKEYLVIHLQINYTPVRPGISSLSDQDWKILS